MSPETIEVLLTMLKTDLGITTDAYDTRLTQYLRNAEEQIAREGVTLDGDAIGDQQLVAFHGNSPTLFFLWIYLV